MIEFRAGEGERFDMSTDQWLAFANRASFHAARATAKSMGIDITWDCEAPKTPEGYPLPASRWPWPPRAR